MQKEENADFIEGACFLCQKSTFFSLLQDFLHKFPIVCTFFPIKIKHIWIR